MKTKKKQAMNQAEDGNYYLEPGRYTIEIITETQQQQHPFELTSMKR